MNAPRLAELATKFKQRQTVINQLTTLFTSKSYMTIM